jgi:hypothetical protein
MARRAFGFALAKRGKEDGLVQCIAASGNSDILAKGDAVVLVGSSTGGAAIGLKETAPAVARGAATGALYGYVESVEQWSAASPNFSQKHRPASTAMYLMVRPFKIGEQYIIRSNGALAVEDIGEVCNLATITDADTSLGLSKMEIDSTSVATSQTAYQMRVVRAYDDGKGNALTDTNPIVVVEINNIQGFHAFGGV